MSEADSQASPSPSASSGPGGAAQVETDYAKNKFFMIYFIVWGVIAIALFVCSYMFEWGFWGWFGGVFAVMVAAGGAGGMAKTGGAGLVNCPACGEQNKILHISEHRIMQCESCRAWIEGAEAMGVVPEDRITDHPAFRTYLPQRHRWPEGCAFCGQTATQELEVESSESITGKYVKVGVPFCDLHDGSRVYISTEVGGSYISFCNLQYFRDFKAMNAPADS